MPHIDLPKGAPGIVGPLQQYPKTAKHLLGLAQELLRGESTLTPGERELIAAYVSSKNNCYFCTHSHSAAARHLLGDNTDLVEQVKLGLVSARVSEKMKALLHIAGKVQQGERSVSEEDVARARAEGATDKELHDSVLIAAAFCMYNRYVDGLTTWTPSDEDLYDRHGARLAANGYVVR
ncbi:MAG TPA: peroxidase-related enzyme [Rhodothermales bacterium]|nr:peroxidase-related enzyme [Rhodothermales bacterium]